MYIVSKMYVDQINDSDSDILVTISLLGGATR